MNAAFESSSRTTAGTARLLEHCETLARVTGKGHSRAHARLESELGPELARRLVGALTRRGGRSGLLLV